MAMLEDRLLIWRLKRGHEPALVRVYTKYKNLLLKLACGLVRDTGAAEDLVQDVFVSLAESADRLRVNGSLKGYLIQSVLNRARNLHRAESVRQSGAAGTLERAASEETRPERWVLHHEQLQHLHRALEQLPLEQREVVTLHLRAELTFREIARVQGVSSNTVQSRYRYGLEKLRALMNSEWQP
jgi:RNA polymerase sigma-70 factor (ECF subfamily)